MRIMVETTDWADYGDNINHVYVFNDSLTKIMGYVPRGSRILHKFKQPMTIDTKGRTFEELGEAEPPAPEQITVQGSNGSTYYLTEDEGVWQCTCPGFKFRGACKHTTERNNPTVDLASV